MMMSQDLVSEVLRYCKSTFGIDLSPSSGPRDLLAAELGLLKSLVRLGRAAMQSWCQQLGDGDRGARASKDGVSYRRVGKRAKTIHGLFGWVTYVRVYYARLGAGGAGWAPLDEQFGVQRGYLPGCQYFMAYFCGRQAYQEGLDHFHEVFRADGKERVSMNKAYEMVCAVNEGLEQQRQQEIKEYLEDDKRVAVQQQITATMVVCVDATKVPTRASRNVADEDNKSYECQYRDSKVATVSAVERKGADEHAPEQKAEDDAEVRLTKTTCVTGIEHADEFFPRIEVEMQRRSAHLATLILVVIADGAAWIWDRVADLAGNGQEVWHILDFWHACDHLATIGRLMYGDGTDRFKECFKRWRGMLSESRSAEVIEELTKLRDGGEYPTVRADIQGQIDYFTANQKRMDYRRYRELGLPIGSGTVESACKNVVAARMKHSGMMWGLPGATGMLQLRASIKSRRFNSDHERLLHESPPQEIERMAA